MTTRPKRTDPQGSSGLGLGLVWIEFFGRLWSPCCSFPQNLMLLGDCVWRVLELLRRTHPRFGLHEDASTALIPLRSSDQY
jgi:hypothetical protein